MGYGGKKNNPIILIDNQEIAAQLAEKVTQEDVNVTVAPKADKIYVDSNITSLDTKINSQASGSPKGVYTTVLALQTAFPTGNTNVYLVTGNVKEVASLTVTAIPTTAGNVTVTLNGVATNIAVDPATDTTINAVATKIRNTTYSTGAVTGGTGSIVTFTASAAGVKTDATYSAGSNGATGTMTTTTQGVDPDGKWYYWNGSAWTTGGVYQATAIGKGVVTQENTNFLFVSSNNLLKKDSYIAGTTISNFGNPLASTGNNATDFTPILPSTDYKMIGVEKYAYYDASKTFLSYALISNSVETLITTPSNAAFLRGVIKDENLSTARLNKGTVLQSYDEYALSINYLKVPSEEPIVVTPSEPTAEEKFEALKADDKYVINGVLDSYYVAPVMPAVLDLGTWTTANMFAMYDALMTDHPEYITRTTLGTDSLGETLYRYDFKPSEVGTVSPANAVKLPKMILISGIHGDEKAGVYNLYNSMKQICENWKTNELLETLRWNVHFIVVPIVSLYGFNNPSRHNENGVDLARNFPTLWQAGTPGSLTYGGTAPLSEKGAQYIDQIMSANKDAIYFGSHHNFFEPTDHNYFVWNNGGTKLQINLGKQLIARLSRKWKQRYEWMPQNNTTFLGYASYPPAYGSEGRHAVYYGIQAGTFEIDQEFFIEPNHTPFSSIVFTLGLETFINWLILNLKNNCDYYNTNTRL